MPRRASKQDSRKTGFGSFIRAKRIEKGWTLEKLEQQLSVRAKDVALSRQTLGNFELGDRVPTDTDQIAALADVLGVSQHSLKALAGEAYFEALPETVHLFVQRELSRRLRRIPTDVTDEERQLLELLRTLDDRNREPENKWRSAAETLYLLLEFGGDDWLSIFRRCYLAPIDVKARIAHAFRSTFDAMQGMYEGGYRRRAWDEVGGPPHPVLVPTEEG